MKNFSLLSSTFKLAGVAVLAFNLGQSAYAMTYVNSFNYIGEQLGCFTLDCAHWYIGGNMGVSHLFDKRTPNTSNSVNENGPGWNVNGGFQFNSILGIELGFNQYHDSRETIGAVVGSTTIAKTEHYSTYLAATLHYPLLNQVSAFGKLGAAYSYANKIFLTGPSASSGSLSPYFGLGLAYSVTPKFDFNFQWSRALGNHYTGSADLYTLGFTAAVTCG